MMRAVSLNQGWILREGLFNLLAAEGPKLMKKYGIGEDTPAPGAVMGKNAQTVNVPHDYMIASDTAADAPAGAAMGYFTAGVANYTKYVDIPSCWEGERIYLHSDGIMMNASIDVNGSQICQHHYGYTPVWTDLTDVLHYGAENRITITVNPSMQPNSRWYSGAGLYRDIELVHVPDVHIAPDGISAWTKEIADIPCPDGSSMRTAFIHTETAVRNCTMKKHLVEVTVRLIPDDDPEARPVLVRSTQIMVRAGETASARIPFALPDPRLWSDEKPDLYRLEAEAKDLGVFTTCLQPSDACRIPADQTSVLFGVRTISADAVRGLLINGRSVKLKGGCVHHDNGLLGAASLYDAEYRKVSRLKECGFNAIRTAHNPPSAVLLEVCDRLGVYVFDEVFDAWSVAKQPGDYNQFFASDWKADMRSLLLRDRTHPSVILWSTGNEIPERAGMADGYALAAELADYMRSLDPSRPVTNGICSFWCGLDDENQLRLFEESLLSREDGKNAQDVQNLAPDKDSIFWEERTIPFAAPLDIVGYNYLDQNYEKDHEMFPDRVILGTESYPKEIDRIWALVKKNAHVIGDFTWTCYDYIGEAGIGKSGFFDPEDPRLANPLALVASHNSPYPWRLANDADHDVNGGLMPQGVYRHIVWGSERTGLFVQAPEHFGKTELISGWGWDDITASWTWRGAEGQPVKVVVYSAAPEVELFLNGKSLGRQAAGEENRFTASFNVTYEPGVLEAVSITDGKEISRSRLSTAGTPAAIRLAAETMALHPGILRANGSDLQYVAVEVVDADGQVVPDAVLQTTAQAEGAAVLAGYGSANPQTTENYTQGKAATFRGKAMAILRTGYTEGEVVLRVKAEGLPEAELKLTVIGE